MAKTDCDGNHHYFALEPIIEIDGSITIVIVCTACSDLVTHRLPSPVGKSKYLSGGIINE